MQFPSLVSLADLLLLNVVAASILLGLTAIIVAYLVRRTSLSLQHGLLCVVLVLTLASPLPIWIATNQGFGIVPISLAGSDRETPDNFDAPEQIAGDAGVSFQMPESLDKSQSVETAEGKSLPSTKDLMTQVAKPGTGSAEAAGLWPSQLSVIFVTIWLAIALWLSLRLVRGLLMIHQLRRSLRPTNDPRLIAAVARIATIREGCMDICESHLAPSPLTLGWWRSVIVMPVGLAELLDDEELECVLAHEAAHVARHDTAIAVLQQLCAIGFWWNPLLHAVNRQISRLREQICDDAVVKCYGDGLPLARALVRVAEWSSRYEIDIPLAPALLEDDNDEIENRIHRLADTDRTVSVGLNAWSASLIATFGIALAAVLLVPVVRAQVVAAPPATVAVNPEQNQISDDRIGAQTQDSASTKTDDEKANEEREARMAKVEPEFKKVYYLKEGEVLRHVPEPVDRELHSKYYKVVSNDSDNNFAMEIEYLYVAWKDSRPQWFGTVFGLDEEGSSIRGVLEVLRAVWPQYIEGDTELLSKKITGDLTYEPTASADEIVAAMQPILQKEWGIPVRLVFRDVERDVYIVRGEWKFKPISDEFPDVQIYGNDLASNRQWAPGKGKFDSFLETVGKCIDLPIISEVQQPPSKTFEWRYNLAEQPREIALNPENVIANLTKQTGLNFVKERRMMRILFVERQE